MKDRRPLKRAKLGLEFEFFLIDETGRITNQADNLLKKLRKLDTAYSFRKEFSHSQIEMNGFPRRRVENAARGILNNLEILNKTARDLGLYLYPHGTYPGRYTPVVRNTGWYEVKTTVYGKKQAVKECTCCGVHMHYSLPRGVLDKKKNMLRHMANSKITDALICEYNLILALDPVITTLLQSSPLINGLHLGKDCRTLIYRDLEIEKFGQKFAGAYHDLVTFGGFPRYMQTIEDMNQRITHRYTSWIEKMKDANCYPHPSIKNKTQMDFYWGPLRINKVGSYEHRGLDMNYPKYIFGVSVLMKALLRRIHREYLKVVPSDIAIDSPLKVEGDTLYIPPWSKLKNELQVSSALYGLEDPEIQKYVKRFIKLALNNMPEKYDPTVAAVKDMVKKNKTVSDRIISMIKKRGYSLDEPVPDEVCAEIALKRGEQMEKEIDIARGASLVLNE